jgi:hypothetical protein
VLSTSVCVGDDYEFPVYRRQESSVDRPYALAKRPGATVVQDLVRYYEAGTTQPSWLSDTTSAEQGSGTCCTLKEQPYGGVAERCSPRTVSA